MSNTRITTSNGRFWNHPILMSVIQLDEKLASEFRFYSMVNVKKLRKSSVGWSIPDGDPNPIWEKYLLLNLAHYKNDRHQVCVF